MKRPAAERLARRLQRERPEISFSRAKRAVEEGQVTVDGVRVDDPGRLIAPAAQVVWDANRPVEHAVPRPKVELLHVDEDVAVAVKPAGLLTQPTTDREKDTLLSRVSLAVARRRSDRPYVAVVHRLDKDTSGLVVFALSRRALESLQRQLATRALARIYDVIVEGDLERDAGVYERDLAGDGTHRRRWVARPGEKGKPARTNWEVLARFGGVATHLRVSLETGRTHQIRIHFAAADHPVLGDRVYRPRHWSEPLIEAPRQALHAGEIAFQHPADGRRLRFTTPLPDDLRGLLAKLRRGVKRR